MTSQRYTTPPPLAAFVAVENEARALVRDTLQVGRSMEMPEADVAELLRMIQECRRFIAVPMPEEKLPF